LHLYTRVVKPKRITVPLIINSSNHSAPEDPHTMNRNIGCCRMREYNARPVIICEDQRTLERTRRQHNPIGADMPDPNAGTVGRRGISKMVASPLNGDYIILVI
jgi:hypothetical protein